jgi:transposase-like protein
MKTFKSILEFQKHFDTDAKCREYLEQQRWGNEPACCFCGSFKVRRLKDGKRFQCNEKECRKQFSVTVGTIAENTKIPLTKWLLALYILSNHSKGISSLQLAKWLGVQQRTAWFLNHRIRVMLTDKAPKLLEGITEVDETYVGGRISRKHKSKRKLKPLDNKTMVFGAVQRGGDVITKIIFNNKAESLINAVRSTVKEGSTMVSDENVGYFGLKEIYTHETVNHSKDEFVRGWVHTQSIDSFWNTLKKQISGIHHFVSPKHLQRYCNEAAYRHNRRNKAQDERFTDALRNCEGRLKYNDLIK